MNDDYLKKMESFIKSTKIDKENQGKNNNDMGMGKDELFKCFQMYMNNQQKSKIASNPIEQHEDMEGNDSGNDYNNQYDDEDYDVQEENLRVEKEEIGNREAYTQQYQSKITGDMIQREDEQYDNTTSNNIDDIPIKPKKVDFNKLVEQELAKGEYQGSDNPSQVRFEYKKRPKYNERFKVSEPTEGKKYKYYSDNFKSKGDEEIPDHQFKKKEEITYPKRGKSGVIKRVAPVMPEKTKEMFSRGKNQPKPSKNTIVNTTNGSNSTSTNPNNNTGGNKGRHEREKSHPAIQSKAKEKEKEIEFEKEIKSTSSLVPIQTGQKELESLWREYKLDNDDNEFLDFNTTKQVRNIMNEKKNITPMNAPLPATLQKPQYNNTNTNKNVNLNNYNSPNDEEEDEFDSQINKILNQKIPSAISSNNPVKNNYNSYQMKQKEEYNVDQDEEEEGSNQLEEDNFYAEENHKNHPFPNKENKREYNHPQTNNEDDNNNNEDNDNEEKDDDDNREILQMYSDQLFEKETVSKLNPQPIEQKQKIIPEQSRIINKYFKNTINKNAINNPTTTNSNQQPPTSVNLIPPKAQQEIVNGIVNEKIEELDKNLQKLQKENAKVSELKNEYDRLTKKLRLEIDDFAKKREADYMEFEKMKEEELKKIERERKVQLRNTKLLQNLPNKKEREEIDGLKEQVLKLQEDMKMKDQRNKLAMDRLKKQLEESQKKNEEYQKEIKVYEELRLKSMSKPVAQKANSSNVVHYNNPAVNSNNNNDKEAEIKTIKSSKNIGMKKNSSNTPLGNVKNIISSDNKKGNNPLGNSYRGNSTQNLMSNIQGQNEIKVNTNSKNQQSKSPIVNSSKQNSYYDNQVNATNKEFNYSNNKNDHLDDNDNDNNDYQPKENDQYHDEEQEEAEEGDEDNNNNPTTMNQAGTTETFEMVFLEKYHNPKLATQLKLIDQNTTPDGKIIKTYENNKKEVFFPSGLKKEIFNDGYQISYFHNKDIRQQYPDGKEVYLFAENGTVKTNIPNGVQICRFISGQIEKNFPDGTRIINYPDGTVRHMYKDGYEEIFFNDGSLKRITKEGLITFEYPDGIKDTIYMDGTKMREYPDGKVIKTSLDGTPQTFYKN